MGGEDDRGGDGSVGGFLTPTTPEADSTVVQQARADASSSFVASAASGGFVAGPEGKALHLDGGAALGFDYASAKCYAAGVVSLTG